MVRQHFSESLPLVGYKFKKFNCNSIIFVVGIGSLFHCKPFGADTAKKDGV